VEKAQLRWILWWIR